MKQNSMGAHRKFYVLSKSTGIKPLKILPLKIYKKIYWYQLKFEKLPSYRYKSTVVPKQKNYRRTDSNIPRYCLLCRVF